MRILLAPLLTLALIVSEACTKNGNGTNGSPTGPTSTPAPGAALIYSAVGASDVLGIGSTSPCFLFEDCNGTGYVWVAARQLRSQNYTVTVGNLGIPAAVISRSFQDLGEQNGRIIPGNLIDQEMPFVNRSANLVTVFTGANDVYVVQTPDEPHREILLPAIDQVIKKVDLDEGILLVELLPGLLDE